MNSADAEALIKSLHAAGLEGSPPAAGWRATASTYLDALGHLSAADVELARRAYISSSTRWPSAAALLGLIAGDGSPSTMSGEEGPPGCPDCGFTGWRIVRWCSRRAGGRLHEGQCAATCRCERGRYLHSAHLTPVALGRQSLQTKSAEDHAADLGRLRLVSLDGDAVGTIAWRISGATQGTSFGEPVEQALRAQAGLAAPRPPPGHIVLDTSTERRREPPRQTLAQRPDAESYDTERVGGWA